MRKRDSIASTARSRPARSALVFFSGYAIQSARQSYIIPVDGQIWTEADVRRDGVSLECILREMNTRGARVKIAILDASRRNPFERRFRRSPPALAPVDAPTGSLVMYSSAPSTVVNDGGGEQRLFRQRIGQAASRAGVDGGRGVQPHADGRVPRHSGPAGAVGVVTRWFRISPSICVARLARWQLETRLPPARRQPIRLRRTAANRAGFAAVR